MEAVMSNTKQVRMPDENLGIMSGLQGMISFFSFGAKKETDHKKMMFEGYHQILDGMYLFLQGAEVSLNKQIDIVLDTHEPSMPDNAFYMAVELEAQIAPMLEMMLHDEMPAKLAKQFLSVRERFMMLITLERQFRPMPSCESGVMPGERGEVIDFQKEREFKVGGWKEA